LTAFFDRTYGPDYTLSDEQHFNWLFDNHLNDSATEYTAFVALSKTGDIVGFYAWAPVTFRYFGALVSCNYQMNLMVQDSHRSLGYGYLLLNAVERNGASLGVTLNVGPDGRRLIEPAGWRLFDLNRHICVFNSKAVEELVGRRHSFTRSSLSAVPDSGRFSIAEIETADPRLDQLSQRLAAKYPITLNRDAAYVQWRWFAHPLLRYRVFTISEGEILVGHFVIRIEEYRQFRIGRLLDVVVDDCAEAFTFASLAQVCDRLRLDLVDCFALGGWHGAAMQGAGLSPAVGPGFSSIPMVFDPPDERPSLNFTFKVLNPQPFDDRIGDTANWYINKADADGDRANRGRPRQDSHADTP
jgi:GNAT superfamily N-acetyltransferase